MKSAPSLADDVAGPEIHLGDLARALGRLQPADAATLTAIASLLGYSVIETYAAPLRGPVLSTPSRETIAPAPSPPRKPPPESSEQHAPPPRRSSTRSLTPRTPPDTIRRSESILKGDALPSQEAAAGRLAPAASLFKPDTVRSIVFFALGTIAYEAEIDVEALTRVLSFQEPWNGEIPCLPRSTLRRGVQVLIDRRPAMSPFYGDQNALFDVIRSVVGEHGSTVGIFRSSPEEVILTGLSQARRFRPPPPGTPVLILSDLGIGNARASNAVPAEAWSEFIRRVGKAGSPVVAFVPYPPTRWPASLMRTCVVIQWDRPTTPGQVRKRLGLGHQVNR
jgi:hypothetical protein